MIYSKFTIQPCFGWALWQNPPKPWEGSSKIKNKREIGINKYKICFIIKFIIQPYFGCGKIHPSLGWSSNNMRSRNNNYYNKYKK